VRFELDHVARFELAERSELLLESVPEAGAEGEIVLELRSGSLRVLTAGALAPARLRVLAPDADVLVVGTELAVDVVPGMGTCVCCTRGVVEVSSRHATGAPPSPERIGAGQMALCMPGSAMTKVGPALVEHTRPE
jgi:ferric-dicitrate binding protein FerR (iron transport regulator)